MKRVYKNKKTAKPSFNSDSLASRLMANPKSSMDGGHSIPLWSEFFFNVLSTKTHICKLADDLVEAYMYLIKQKANSGEPDSLMNGFLDEVDVAIEKINEISSRPSLDGYEGVARNNQETQDVIQFNVDVAAIFTELLSKNTLTISRLQEIYEQVSLDTALKSNTAHLVTETKE